jgi:hypothetical protein
MLNYLKRKWMAFKDIFKDENDINEKSVVGFASFLIMVVFAVADIVTGFFGKDLVIQDFIYNSFVIITLGSFGIAEVGKIFGKKE